MPEINWAELDEHKFERMVAVLLSTLHPSAERIDGSGGDGGRDVQVRTAEGLRIFQLRYVLGRVNKSRRRHIKESLQRAAALNPISWSLVIPIDHTQKELEWFDELRSHYPFPLEWCGLTWLNRHLAEHERIPRYFLWRANDEVVEALAAMRSDEVAYKDGAPDAFDRMIKWAHRLNEIDPFYVFDVAVRADGSASVTVAPRYKGAEVDRPIVASLDAEFPEDDAGRRAALAFQASINAGTPMDLAPSYVKSLRVEAGPSLLTGTHSNVAVRISQDTPEGWKVTGALVVRGANGDMLARLPINYTERTAGSTTRTMVGQDPSGALTVRLFAPNDGSAGTFQFHYGEATDLTPSAVLPALNLVEQLHVPNRVDVLLEGKVVGSLVPEAIAPLVPAGYPKLIASLARLQEAAADYYPIPATFDAADLESISRGVALLDGESLDFTWSRMVFGITVVSPPELALAIVQNTAARLRLVTDYPVTIAGREMRIPGVAWELDEARIANRRELERQLPFQQGEELRLELVPGSMTSGRALIPGRTDLLASSR